MATRHTVLSGDSVELDGPFDTTLPCTTTARWAIYGQRFEFSSGKLDYAEQFARSLGVSEFESEFSFEGGVLKIGTDQLQDSVLPIVASRTWAVWQGQTSSWFTQRIEMSREHILQAISAFQVAEDEDGVRLVPRDATVMNPIKSAGRPCVYKGFDNVGLLTVVARSRDGDRMIPQWAGKRVRGGELFQGSDTKLTNGGMQKSLLFVTNSAMAQVDVNLDADEESAVGAMSELLLTWIGL